MPRRGPPRAAAQQRRSGMPPTDPRAHRPPAATRTPGGAQPAARPAGRAPRARPPSGAHMPTSARRRAREAA
eukprot:scaffold116126_cov63-Phaeocystis_antarctica.AAC.2